MKVPPPRSGTKPTAILAFLLCCILPACTAGEPDPPAESAALAELLGSPGSHLLRIGDRGGVDDTAAIVLDIKDARITTSGDHIVVLNRFPPFVRVFDWEGRPEAAFAEEGGGPGEARNPHGIAVLGDTAIMMLEPASLSFFDIDGEFIRRISDLEFLPVRATSGCAGKWILYGPPQRGLQSARNTWLRTLDFGSDGEPRYGVLYSDAVPYPQRVGLGNDGEVWADESDVLFFHEDGTPPALIRSPCGDDEPDRSSERLMVLAAEQEDETIRSDYAETTVSTLGDQRYPHGVTALQDGGSLWLALGFLPDLTTETYFGTAGGADMSTVVVSGSYTLHDRTADGRLLFSTPDPFPAVFVVAESEVLDAMQ